MSDPSDKASEQFLAFDVAEQLLTRIRAGEQVDLEQQYAAFPQFAQQIRQIVEQALVNEASNGKVLVRAPEQTPPAVTSSADTKAEHSTVPSSVEKTIVHTPRQAVEMYDNDEEDLNSDNPHGYLSPSTKPGSRGRLGHYEVLEILGKGAFGTVLKAFDEKLHRMVAIKVMSTQLASTSPARKRFLREARASAAIRHDNVVAIYAVEEQPIPYLVMEYVPGQTLQQALDRDGPFDLDDALRLGQQIASGLAAAHAQGLIHRDIKPANILLEEGPHWKVKITDFGLARAADDASRTQSGIIAGTPMYMSPEQAHGSNVDLRSDLFSFGSVLYQIVSGRPPFRASSTLAVLKRVTEDRPRPIREIIPEVPEWLVTIIAKLHEKKAVARYQSAAEVSELLARCQLELQQDGRVTCVPVTRSNRRNRGGPSQPNVVSSTVPVHSPIDDDISGLPLNVKAYSRPVSSRRSARTFHWLRIAPLTWAMLLAAALALTVSLAYLFIIRAPTESSLLGVTPPSGPSAGEISEPEPQRTVASSWYGWPTDAPPPAIAPFSAEQARQHQEAWATYLKIPVEYTNSIGMRFRLMPPGEFTMGSTAAELTAALQDIDPNDRPWRECVKSESPQHEVILTKPIYIGVCEVTQKDFERVMGFNPSHFSATGMGKDSVLGSSTENHPVEMVSWTEVTEFCSALGKHELHREALEQTDTSIRGNGYRLPTEAEWEFSCRAGTMTAFSTGDMQGELTRNGWSAINSVGRTHGVMEFGANSFGLYDLHGNVWEWTGDSWDATFYSQVQGKPAVDPICVQFEDSQRVIRGGSWRNVASSCRSATHSAYRPAYRVDHVGMRLALEINAVQAALALEGSELSKPQDVGSKPEDTDPGASN